MTTGSRGDEPRHTPSRARHTAPFVRLTVATNVPPLLPPNVCQKHRDRHAPEPMRPASILTGWIGAATAVGVPLTRGNHDVITIFDLFDPTNERWGEVDWRCPLSPELPRSRYHMTDESEPDFFSLNSSDGTGALPVWS